MQISVYKSFDIPQAMFFQKTIYYNVIINTASIVHNPNF